MFPLRDANPRHGPALVVWLLVLINVAVFLYELGFNERQTFVFVMSYGFVPDWFFTSPLSQAYRLLTSMFLHGGVMHIVGNLFFLIVFGDNVEDKMGHGRFLVFYLLGGAAATLAHGAFMPSAQTPMIGASGAISAVLGAYIVLFPRQRVLTFIPPFFMLWLPAWLYLGYWAVIQFIEAAGGLAIPASDVSGVAWWAHVGGFVFGMLLVRTFAKNTNKTISTRV